VSAISFSPERSWGAGGKNPEWTVCQIHKAIAAQINSLWLNGQVCTRLLEQLVEEISTTQRDNAKSRKSHQKRTRRRLRQKGIMLTQVRRCIWPPG
jgi:hypothetical protein